MHTSPNNELIPSLLLSKTEISTPDLNVNGLGKVVACWIGTPVGGFIFSVLLYKLVGHFYNKCHWSIFRADRWLRLGLVAAGSYGAYTLGANNVANVSAVFVGSGQLSVLSASLFGGICIALGIITYSRPVMETVGKKLVKLDPFSALIVRNRALPSSSFQI